MSFLPENYTAPASSGGNYTKFNQGKTSFRIIGSAIVGWIAWRDKQPLRSKGKPTGEFEDKPKHFWAFPVWNHEANCIQICEVTQRGIQNALLELKDDEQWGDPKRYDVTVNREGEGLETSYTVIPRPPAELSSVIVAEIKEKLPLLNIEALYDGEDPFAAMNGDAPSTSPELAEPF